MTDSILQNNGQNPETQDSRPVKTMTREKKRLLFYICIIAFPLLHLAVFWVYVSLQTYIMAFQEYTTVKGVAGYQMQFVGFKNFVGVINFFKGTDNITTTGVMVSQWSIFGNSFLLYFISLCFIPVAISFSYYIYKGYKFGNFFRVVLYLPQIMSGTVMVLIYQTLLTYWGVNFTVPGALPYVFIYNFWTSFGSNVILYVGAMCGINVSISESAQLDGATAFKEFWYITIPMIFPTITTFIVLGVAGIFSNQGNLFLFYGENAPFQTMGHLYFVQFWRSGLVKSIRNNVPLLSYPELSALGLMITLFVVPVTMLVRKLLNKYGPSDH